MSEKLRLAAFAATPTSFFHRGKRSIPCSSGANKSSDQTSRVCAHASVQRTVPPEERAASISPSLKATSNVTEELCESGALDPKDAPMLGMLSASRAALFAKVLTNRTRHITFVLDGVYGAHNLAAIARSCDAWGIQDLHVVQQPEEYVPNRHKGNLEKIPQTVSILERFNTEQSVQNVSKNCHKWLTIKEYPTSGPCLAELRAAGYKIIVSSLSTDSQSINDVDLSGKCAFVFGHETHGVTKEMEAQADGFFTIPMMGFVESMNVSVAVGTTACLTTTKCKGLMQPSEYLLSHEQMRELAHVWLSERFSVKKAPKKIHSRRDVTKLGHACEVKIIKEGMFASIENKSLTGAEFWGLALRPTGDGGRRAVTYVVRRVSGILGEIDFNKRCLAINFTIGGSHALTCEAALCNKGSPLISRERLYQYFELVCEEVNAAYRPYFDQFGVPSLPVYAEESSIVFSNLESSAPHISAELFQQIASDLFGIPAEEMYECISSAGLADIARCVAETVRCDEQKARELEEVAAKKSQYLSEMITPLNVNIDEHKWSPTTEETLSWHSTSTAKDLLHIFLRLSNASQMCSELYQTVWDRHKRNNVSRIHSPTFGLLESVLSDSYSEMILRKTSHQAALCRAMLEWHRVLEKLQNHIAKI